MADSIRMRGIQLPAALGVSAGERALRRPVEIDLDLHCDLGRSAATDDLGDTVDYVAVWETIARVMGAEFRLAEALAERICAELFATFDRLEEVRIEVRKLAPLPGAVRTAGVELTRRRPGDSVS
jgi:dihydroneopterin aldolase